MKVKRGKDESGKEHPRTDYWRQWKWKAEEKTNGDGGNGNGRKMKVRK